MTAMLRAARPVFVTLALALAAPALAQSVPANADARLRALESEVKALQRQVFPGGDGKYFPPQVQPRTTATPTIGTPAATPVSDLLVRMDAVEAQLARLTAQGEENGNRLAKLEARLAATAAETVPAVSPPATSVVPGATTAPTGPAASATAPTPAPAAASTNGAITNTNLAAMTGGASAPKPATAAATSAAKPAAAGPARVAAVKAIEKPSTSDAGEDEYSYGFRLYDAAFYPEAEQQLKMFLQKYPRHSRVSYARNLLGRAYLDEGNAREAASWFLQNYQANKRGDRAPDSLLNLAAAMRQMKDTTRSCVALAQFGDDYAAEAAGRLKSQYDSLRKEVKCN